ncbi:MAG: sigma 54-interacting transcriptional regulator [Mailhella sp.]|nr:sigma 54-interacting transcriptional regulator [Mailhella sp.]
MNKILFLGATRDVCETAKDISKEYGIAADIAIYGAFVSNELLYDPKSYAVIVTQPGLVRQLEAQNPTAVILAIHPTATTYVNAMLQAVRISKNIAMFNLPEARELFELLQKHTKLFSDVTVTYLNKGDGTYVHLNATDLDGKVLVGIGGSIAALAQRFNVPYVLAPIDYNDILEILLTASKTLQSIESARFQSDRAKQIFSLIQTGIVTFTPEGELTEINDRAQSLLGLSAYEKNSQRYLEILNKLYGNGADMRLTPMRLNGLSLMVGRQLCHVSSTKSEVIVFLRLRSQASDNLSVGTGTKYKTHWTFSGLKYQNENFAKCIEKAKKFSATDAPLLVEGETGTGKEVIVQSVHNGGKRASKPFMAINCATFNKELLESELFGYDEGAFTGAKRGGKKGLFEVAEGGTVFLDEVSEIPVDVQSKLLRAFQEKQVMHVGGTRTIPIDVRIIAASNRPLLGLVEKGLFRRDLYYRLSLLRLQLPPLRERFDDMPLLIGQFLDKLRYKYDGLPAKFPQEVLALMRLYDWPGNVRELENVVERMCILSGSPSDMTQIFQDYMEENRVTERNAFSSAEYSSLSAFQTDEDHFFVPAGTMQDMKNFIIKETIRRCGGSKQKAADMLQISRATLWKEEKK